tara:strand:- start:8 stop:115 length:108 start_codon:yes stop_codon:yes gene_type:complete
MFPTTEAIANLSNYLQLAKDWDVFFAREMGEKNDN